jgi:phosphoenolpyruvate carboxylase
LLLGYENLSSSLLTIGNWIGGDRDGNPHVNDEVLRYALFRQSSVALNYYLIQTKELRRELSQSLRVIQVTPEIEQLARLSTDTSVHRHDEPYRLALTHVYDRLAATAAGLSPRVPNEPVKSISRLTRIRPS